MKFLLISIFVISFIGIVLIPDTFGESSHIRILKGSSDPNACKISYSCFEPTEHTVGLNDIVIWQTLDVDGVKHHVTSKDGKFDSPALEQRNSQNACWPNCINKWSYIFAEYGTYDYYCKIHPWMKGTVIVTGKGLNAEVSVSNEWGSAYIDKYEYEAAPDKTIYVKIYGDVTRQGTGDKVTLFITHPNGKIETNYVVIASGEWEAPIKVEGLEHGQFRVDVQHEPVSIGILEFEVVRLLDVMSPPTHLQSSTDTITIELDSESYKQGDTIKIAGSVNMSSDPLEAFDVTVKIQDPKNNLKVINQIAPKSDSSYSIPIQTGDSWNKDGVYTVTVSYDNYSTTTSFAFSIPTPTPTPTPASPSKTSTVLTLNSLPSRMQVGETLSFSGTLWTSDGKPMTDQKIQFWNGEESLGSISTHLDGGFAGTLEMTQIGDYRIFAYFYGGTSDFESDKSQTQYLTVERNPGAGTVTAPPEDDSPVGGVVLLVIIMIVIITVAIKKRKKKIPIVIQPPTGRGATPSPTATGFQTSKPTGTGFQTAKPAGRAKILRKRKSAIKGKFKRQAKRPGRKQSLKSKSGMEPIHLLRCGNITCRSVKFLKSEADGQQYCTKCGWKKR